MKLYIPTSSKNYSIIFETESVSPKVFYSKRAYGNTRYRSSPLDISEEYITLYSEPPIVGSIERENYSMLLEIDSETLSSNLTDLSKVSSGILPNTVFIYPQTIYFDTSSFRCIFENEKQCKDTQIDSESFSNVKTASKYSIVAEEHTFFTRKISLPNVQVSPNALAEIEIEKDRRFNHFKGFIYGYAIGELNDRTPEDTEFARLVNELQSTFTNSKSQIIMRNSGSEKNASGFYGKTEYSKNRNTFKTKYDYVPPKYDVEESKGEILDLISDAENIYFKVNKNSQVKENDEILQLANEILDRLIKENAEVELISQGKKFFQNLSIRNKPFEKLKDATKDFFRFATSKIGVASEQAEHAERRFKSNLMEISRTVEKSILYSNSLPKSLNPNQFIFENSYSINIDRRIISLPEQSEYVLFEVVVSTILGKTRPAKKGEITRDEKLELIESLGKKINSNEFLSNTQINNDLRAFYKSIEKFNSFKVENVKSIVLKNYISFISKIDRLDELVEFSEMKRIENRKIGYSFWCAYNGFSEISEKNSRIFFSSNNLPLINSFDNFLKSALKKIEIDAFDFLEEKHETRENKENQKREYSFSNSTNLASDSLAANYPPSSELFLRSNETNERGNNKNKKIEEFETYLQTLNTVIWSISISKKFSETQKDDISKGITQLRDLVSGLIQKSDETFLDKTKILTILKRVITDLNKKRKKKENKIPPDTLNELFNELSVRIV